MVVQGEIMSERRKYKRVDVDFAIKGKVVDHQKKVDITGDVLLKAKNLSEGGALLEWPRSWNCDTCSNCLGWVHNFGCKLKKSRQGEGEFDKDLFPGMQIAIQILTGNDIEPVNALAKVNWVKPPEEENADRYHVGVSFIESDKRDQDIKKKILIIKKNLEVN